MPSDSGHKRKDKTFHLNTRKNFPLRLAGLWNSCPGRVRAWRCGESLGQQKQLMELCVAAVERPEFSNEPRPPNPVCSETCAALRTRAQNQGHVEDRGRFCKHVCNHTASVLLINKCVHLLVPCTHIRRSYPPCIRRCNKVMACFLSLHCC